MTMIVLLLYKNIIIIHRGSLSRVVHFFKVRSLSSPQGCSCLRPPELGTHKQTFSAVEQYLEVARFYHF